MILLLQAIEVQKKTPNTHNILHQQASVFSLMATFILDMLKLQLGKMI